MPNFSFSIDGEHFLLDGTPLQIRSAEMHPARIPAEYSNVCRAPSIRRTGQPGSEKSVRFVCIGAPRRCRRVYLATALRSAAAYGMRTNHAARSWIKWPSCYRV